MGKQTAPQGRSTQSQYQDADPSKLLDEIIAKQQGGAKYKLIEAKLDELLGKITEVLPSSMKGEAGRLVKRAMVTFSRNPFLQEVTPASFIRCVLEAAECGLAIDGKLAHAVPYNNKIKHPDGREEWRKESQFQPDYKGIIAIAKRTGQIKDCYGDVVCEKDRFEHGRSGPTSKLEHSYDERSPRGDVVAAYAIIVLPDGWRYELMQRAELNAIEGRSKSAAKGHSPWKTDANQMRIKTVIKRGLKLYCDDPGLIRAIELDDREFEGEQIQRSSGKRVAVSPLNSQLVPVAPRQSAFEQPTQPERHYEPTESQVDEREPGDDSEQPVDDLSNYVENENGELFPKNQNVGQ